MFGVGRDLCGSPSPTPAEAGSPRAGCMGPRPGRAWISPEKETPQPLWAAWARLRHPQSEEVLPHVQVELPLLQFVPVAPCPVAGHHWKESGPILLKKYYLSWDLGLGILYIFIFNPKLLALGAFEEGTSTKQIWCSLSSVGFHPIPL